MKPKSAAYALPAVVTIQGSLTAILFLHFIFGTPVLGATPDQDLAARIARSPVFYQKLMLVGSPAPAPGENEILWSEVQNIRAQGLAPSIPVLEDFTATRTNSPWKLSIEANLARYYRETGRYTKALDTFESVWLAIGKEKEGPAKLIADFAFAHWTQLLSSLGRVDKLRELFEETKGRTFDAGPLQQLVLNAQDGYYVMLHNPAICFKCGTFALNGVGRALHGPSFETNGITQTTSPSAGFTMAQLLEFSASSGLDLVPCEWGGVQRLVVPSVVHWRQDHYAAVLEERNGQFLVSDPTFGRPQWLAGR
jgi:hypothetical protein